MRHVGHSVRSVTIECVKFVLTGTDNHQVWANVELMGRGTILRRFPEAEIHVRDADAINVRRAAGKAVQHPAQEYRVVAPWLFLECGVDRIVRIPRNSRETGPFVRSSANKPVFTSRHGWPIEHSRVLADECGTGAPYVRDLLCVSHRQSIRRLSKGGSHGQDNSCE